MPKIVTILVLTVLLCLSCSSSDSPAKALRSPTTASATNSTPTSRSTIPLPADLATFRSAELGFEFSYPRRLDTASNAALQAGPAGRPCSRTAGSSV